MDYSAIHVLVIDDELAICRSLSIFLEDFGFKASYAESAEKAFDLMKSNNYNVCIVDLGLPDMAGEELIIQARDCYPEQRHIIYTGSISYTLSRKLQDLGMRSEHVFFKPVQVLTLLVKCIMSLTDERE